MNLPLPASYYDTGITATVRGGGTMLLRPHGPEHPLDGNPEGVYGLCGLVRVHGWEDTSNGRAVFDITLDNGGARSVRAYGPLNSHAPHPPYKISVNLVAGPYRLGVAYLPTGTSHPMLGAHHYKLRYAWFADSETQIVCPGWGVRLGYRQPSFGGTEAREVDGSLIGIFRTWAAATPESRGWDYAVKFTNLSAEGWVPLTSHLAPTHANGFSAKGISPGSFLVKSFRDVSLGGGLGRNIWDGWHAPPFKVSYDVQLSKDGAIPWPDAHFVDSWACRSYKEDDIETEPHKSYLTGSDNGHLWIGKCQSWPTGEKPGTMFLDGASFLVNHDWASVQDPPLSRADDVIPVRGPRVATNPAVGHDCYTPLEVTVEPKVDVLAPDGNTPSRFVSTDTGAITVDTGEDGAVTLTCTEAGAAIKRTLKADSWRNWLASLYDWQEKDQQHLPSEQMPAVDPAGYVKVRHAPGEDVWWWGTHAFLEVEIDSPDTTTLGLTLNWSQLIVTDNHLVGSNEDTHSVRLSEMEVTEIETDASYTFQVRAGKNAVLIDLLFPDSGGPVYPGRVNWMTLDGFSVGTYTLTAMKLKPIDNAVLKVGFGVPHSRRPDWKTSPDDTGSPDYSVSVLSVNGSWAFGNIPDDKFKPDEVGGYGGSVRYVEPMESLNAGVLDYQYSLPEFWAQVEACTEGITVNYDADAYRQEFQSTSEPEKAPMGPQNADWTEEILPYVKLTPGAAYTPDCSPCANAIIPANHVTFKVYAEHALHGSLEVLASTNNGKRAPAGRTVIAWDGGPGAYRLIAQTVTDKWGYAVLTPVPANETHKVGVAWDDSDDDAS